MAWDSPISPPCAKPRFEAALDDANHGLLNSTLETIAAAARGELLRQGVAPERIRIVERVHLRYDGTDSSLVVGFGAIADMVKEFEAAYRMRYSFLMPGRALIAEAVSVEAIGLSDAPTEIAPPAARRQGMPEAAETVAMHTGGAAHPTPGLPPRCAGPRRQGARPPRSSPSRTRPPSSSPAAG